jgi:hypothetical protein
MYQYSARQRDDLEARLAVERAATSPGAAATITLPPERRVLTAICKRLLGRLPAPPAPDDVDTRKWLHAVAAAVLSAVTVHGYQDVNPLFIAEVEVTSPKVGASAAGAAAAMPVGKGDFTRHTYGSVLVDLVASALTTLPGPTLADSVRGLQTSGIGPNAFVSQATTALNERLFKTSVAISGSGARVDGPSSPT